MTSLNILEFLKKPEIYDENVEKIKIIQTHISFVALTGKYAYKIKKPVNFGFLDFSDIKKRKYFSMEELRLNQRLCPDIYIDVLPITKKNEKLKINGDGEIVEYTLKMKEFPQENIMTNLLKESKIDLEIIDKICDILVNFYDSQEEKNEIKKYGKLEAVKQNIDENFEQTKPVVNITISKKNFDYIKKTSNDFIKQKNYVFEKRIKNLYIHDCHGDLHSGNIVILKNEIYIFDCIEFNKRFRYCDVASDIGFLAMDLDYQNKPYLSSHLIKKYVVKSNDIGIFNVLNFYKSYRAYVRGKVIGFQLNDPNISKEKRDKIIKTAKKYFDLSRYYTSLFEIDLKNKRPILFIICGLTGTGKSTLSTKISIDYHTQYINTDIIRKELAGIDIYERHHDEPDTGLYSPEKVDNTYKKVMEKAAFELKSGKNVVIDATFQKKKYRDKARDIANENDAILIIIECTCTDETARKWLNERIKSKTVSDGRWEIYLLQKKTFEKFESVEKYIKIDTSEKSYEKRMKSFNKILSTIHEAI